MKKQVYRFTYFPLTCALKRFAKQKKKNWTKLYFHLIVLFSFKMWIFFIEWNCVLSLLLKEIVYDFITVIKNAQYSNNSHNSY